MNLSRELRGVVDQMKARYHYKTYIRLLTREIRADSRRRTHTDDGDKEGWKTVNGTHIHMTGEGEVDKGPAGLKQHFNSGSSSKEVKPKSPSNAAAKAEWNKKVDAQESEFMAKKDMQKGLELFKSGVLPKDKALKMAKDGSIGDYAKKYFTILRNNGDTTPTNPMVDKQRHDIDEVTRNEYGGDKKAARKGLIMKDAGMTEEEAEKARVGFEKFTGGSPVTDADTAALDSYIEKAPVYSGTTWRGLHFKDSDEYEDFVAPLRKIGDASLEMHGNSSWTSDEEVGRRYSHITDDHVDSVIIKCIKNRTGSPIEHLTQHPGEEEVIAHSKASWTPVEIHEWMSYNGCRKAEITVIEKGSYDDE